MITKELSDVLSALQSVDSVANLVSVVNGVLKKANMRAVANLAFGTVSNSEDLDNPTTRGIFNIQPTTIITRPTKGSGWEYGYVINLATNSGIQIWVNFNGYIAVRSKTSSTAPWKDWDVMQKMAS